MFIKVRVLWDNKNSFYSKRYVGNLRHSSLGEQYITSTYTHVFFIAQ